MLLVSASCGRTMELISILAIGTLQILPLTSRGCPLAIIAYLNSHIFHQICQKISKNKAIDQVTLKIEGNNGIKRETS